MDLLLRRSLQPPPAADHTVYPHRSLWEVQASSPLRLSVTAVDIKAASRHQGREQRTTGQPEGLPPTNLLAIRRSPAPIVVRSTPGKHATALNKRNMPSSRTASFVPRALQDHLPDFPSFRPWSPVDEIEPLRRRHREESVESSASSTSTRSSTPPHLSAGNAPTGGNAAAGGLTIPSEYSARHRPSIEGRDGAVLNVNDILRALEGRDTDLLVRHSGPLPGSAASGTAYSAGQGALSTAAPPTSTYGAPDRTTVPEGPPTLLTSQRVEGPGRVTLNEAVRRVRQRQVVHESITRAHQEAVNGYQREANELSQWSSPSHPLYGFTGPPASQPAPDLYHHEVTWPSERTIPGYSQYTLAAGAGSQTAPHLLSSIMAPSYHSLTQPWYAAQPHPSNAPPTLHNPYRLRTSSAVPVAGSGHPVSMTHIEGGSRDTATMSRLARAVAESSGFTSQSSASQATNAWHSHTGQQPSLWSDEDLEAVLSDTEDEEEQVQETVEQAYQRRMRMAARFREASERLRAERLGLPPPVPLAADQIQPDPPATSDSVAPANGQTRVSHTSPDAGVSVWERDPDPSPAAAPDAPAPGRRPRRERPYISLLHL